MGSVSNTLATTHYLQYWLFSKISSIVLPGKCPNIAENVVWCPTAQSDILKGFFFQSDQQSKPNVIRFTTVYDKENYELLTSEKLKLINVCHFCFQIKDSNDYLTLTIVADWLIA